MRNSKLVCGLTIASTLMLGASSSALAQPTDRAQADRALSEMERGDNWIGTNLQKRAVATNPSIENRFNLATGYQRTGRIATAKAYYETLAAEGESVVLSPTSGRGRPFDAAMAAADRLLYIDWLENGATRAGGAVAATEAASNVSATVGGSGDYEVTDAQARALDRQARAAR